LGRDIGFPVVLTLDGAGQVVRIAVEPAAAGSPPARTG